MSDHEQPTVGQALFWIWVVTTLIAGLWQEYQWLEWIAMHVRFV